MASSRCASIEVGTRHDRRAPGCSYQTISQSTDGGSQGHATSTNLRIWGEGNVAGLSQLSSWRVVKRACTPRMTTASVAPNCHTPLWHGLADDTTTEALARTAGRKKTDRAAHGLHVLDGRTGHKHAPGEDGNTDMSVWPRRRPQLQKTAAGSACEVCVSVLSQTEHWEPCATPDRQQALLGCCGTVHDHGMVRAVRRIETPSSALHFSGTRTYIVSWTCRAPPRAASGPCATESDEW